MGSGDGVLPTWTMTKPPMRSAASSALPSISTSSESPTRWRPSLALMPFTCSRLASPASTASSTSAHRESSSSPIVGDIMPIAEMFSSAKSLVSARARVCLRNAPNVSAPAEPASSAVVTPLAALLMSGSTP